MTNSKQADCDKYFWGLEARYKRFMLQKIKTYLDNAGYKGIAFMYMFAFQQMLYKVYKNTPLLDQIISSFEGSFLFDKRRAASQAVEAAINIKKDKQDRPEVITALLKPDPLSAEEYEFFIYTLKEFGQGKVGYIPDQDDFLLADQQQNDFVVKFLVRYYTLKNLIKLFEPSFTKEQIAQEMEKSKAAEKHERENEAVEVIGRKHHPELFIVDFNKNIAQEQNMDAPGLHFAFEKHEWLGTQAELAEHYIELEKKGWIKVKKVKTIKSTYTNSNTIDQILKPGYDGKEATYPQVYTKNYKPMFAGIKQNRKNKG